VDAICYLVDLQQSVLVPFLGPEGDKPHDHVEPMSIDGTLAGRSYQHVQVLVGQSLISGGMATVWLPLLDGTERLGVLAVTVSSVGENALGGSLGRRLRRFASLLGELIMTKTAYGDTIVRLRRTDQMGLAAEMQRSLLPPLTFSSRAVTVAAALEPAYDVAGDAVDYAVDDGVARVALFDSMGHGLRSAQLAAMAVAAYRHARRAGASLVETCNAIHQTVLETFGGASFTTALLAELDTTSGVLSWLSAGHPPPLLLRDGHVVKTLTVRPRPPLGLFLPGVAISAAPSLGTEALEPGDCVLLYTDGVTEARSPDGEFFGDDRLVDLVVRHLAAGLPAPETMRRVVHALLSHQQARLDDDATLLMLQWPTIPEVILP
jgi:hypothetical protein